MEQVLAAARVGWAAPTAAARWFWGAERGRFALWLPVFMGAGVVLYFNLTAEPVWWAGGAVFLPAASASFLAPAPLRALLLPVTAAALGFASAQFATARALPLETLPKKATVIVGHVRGVELLPRGRRVTIEAPSFDGAAPLARRVRVRLRDNDPVDLSTGDMMEIRALVRSMPPPSYPGGWDMQRDTFFTGLAGSGFALGYAKQLDAAAPNSFARVVQWLRDTIEARVMGAIPGAAGAVSATLLTGLTSGIPDSDREAFRDSGLAHILAVAGLHVGIVMGFALALTRFGLALSERAALHWPCRQIAALAALAAGGAYMVLTGMHVPIVRSFAMACLFTLSVVLGRRGVSVRGLALAATAIMLISPQEVVGVSFQMSFSAVLALIAGYEALRPWLRRIHGGGQWHRRFAHHLVTLALTSTLAGTFSAPFGAYHFGRIQLYFVLSNMFAVPLTALWVMPAGLLSLPLIPFGLEWLALVPMGWGAALIVEIARITAALPQATIPVPHAPAWGLAVLSVGIAWLGLWRSRLRLLGLAPIALALISPAFLTPPDLLVSDDAKLIALRTPSGVFVQSVQGASRFTRDAWEEYWAEPGMAPLPAEGVAADGLVDCTRRDCLLRPRADALPALLIRPGASGPARCDDAAVVVSSEPAKRACHDLGGGLLVDRFTVWREGAQAIWLLPDRVRIVSDRETRGDRPWVPPLVYPNRAKTPAGE